MWTNKREINAILSELIVDLTALKKLFEDEEIGALAPPFEQARTVREMIPRDFKRFVDPLADVDVYAEDRPAVLAHTCWHLVQDNISI